MTLFLLPIGFSFISKLLLVNFEFLCQIVEFLLFFGNDRRGQFIQFFVVLFCFFFQFLDGYPHLLYLFIILMVSDSYRWLFDNFSIVLQFLIFNLQLLHLSTQSDILHFKLSFSLILQAFLVLAQLFSLELIDLRFEGLVLLIKIPGFFPTPINYPLFD